MQNTNEEWLCSLLRTVIGHYVLRPENLRIDAFLPSSDLIIFQLQTDGNDHRRVLGKRGATLRALQQVFRAIGEGIGKAIDIRLQPSAGLVEDPLPEPWQESAEFPGGEPIAKTISSILSLICGQEVKVEMRHAVGLTAFLARIPVPIEMLTGEALHVLIDCFGGKARRKLYLELL